ncbi:MAG TPA: hypothetical protein VJ204_05695 [Solirubrobacterales bacterium]|nr:hypothetical protein [Solirubrobacterales bacterium]
MTWLRGLIAGVAVVLVAGFAFWLGSRSSSHKENRRSVAVQSAHAHPSFDPNAGQSGAKKLASEAVEARYNYLPEVARPESVREIKGALFTCEALVPQAGLIPVTLEVISHVGAFVQVASVGQPAAEVAEYRWCKAHGDLKGRAACSDAYMAR